MTVGDRIRAVRKQRNMTQKQVADNCGMKESNFRAYELGNANPKTETLKRIAKALGVPWTALLEGRALRMGDKAKEWVSDKSCEITIKIDSDTMRLLNLFAERDSLSVEDEIEEILHYDLQNRVDDEIPCNIDIY